MTHEQKRCKFCGRTYYYQGSGYGCLENTNDDRYCPRCKAIIDEALEKQVSKEDILTHFPKECEKFDDVLLEKMKELKTLYEEKARNFNMTYCCPLDYEYIEIYHIGRYKYYITYNEDINDKHYFTEYEYCRATKEYIKIYKELGYKPEDSYSIGFNYFRCMRKLSDYNFTPSGMDLPKGTIFYIDSF